ncbi:MAG: GGDEF domain-containing protein, partial [Clostridiaceae bacterium]
MEIEKLKRIILDSEEILMDKTLSYAKKQNYTKYTSTLREAWRMSIAGLSEALVKVIEKSDTIFEMGPDDDFTKSEVAEFGIIEAQRHRSRGVTLSMYLGLMKYYHQA